MIVPALMRLRAIKIMPTSTGATTMTGYTVMTGTTSLGDVLVNVSSMTVYTFTNDTADMSNCNDTCAQTWIPVTVTEGIVPVAAPGIIGTLGVITRTDGTYQVTFNDMPLYTYSQDSQPGDVKGQGVGNRWYVVPVNQP